LRSSTPIGGLGFSGDGASTVDAAVEIGREAPESLAGVSRASSGGLASEISGNVWTSSNGVAVMGRSGATASSRWSLDSTIGELSTIAIGVGFSTTFVWLAVNASAAGRGSSRRSSARWINFRSGAEGSRRADCVPAADFGEMSAPWLLLFATSSERSGKSTDSVSAVRASVLGIARAKDVNRAAAKSGPCEAAFFELGLTFVLIVASSSIGAAEIELEMDSVAMGSIAAVRN